MITLRNSRDRLVLLLKTRKFLSLYLFCFFKIFGSTSLMCLLGEFLYDGIC